MDMLKFLTLLKDLYRGKYFNVVFGNWCQEFVGYCILSSDKESLSELEPEAWEELGKLEKELERICKKIFGTTMFNFACLMNNAYKDNEKPHVHYHFVPRYKNDLKLFNKISKDKHFGYNFWKWSNSKFKCQKDIFTKEEKQKIYQMMKEEWNYNE